MTKLISVLLLLCSCSLFRETEIHEEVQKYTNDFVIDMELNPKTLRGYYIGFSVLSEPTAGICYPGFKTIYIDHPTWNWRTDDEKRALVYHELAHCICFLEHDYTMTQQDEDCPATLMYPETVDDWCIKKYWKSYVFRLKQSCK